MLYAAATRGLAETDALSWRPGSALAVVMAAAGYPEAPRRGDPIVGLDLAAELDGVEVFQAGTVAGDEGLVTGGGRVLAVTAVGDSLQESRRRAYEGVARVAFDGAVFRRDIGEAAAR